jgi:beta propeller repeat protein
MKRRVAVGLLVLVFCLSLLSAFSFDDLFGTMTGEAIGEESISDVIEEVISSVDSHDDVSIVIGDNAFLDVSASHTIERILPVIDKEGSGYFKKVSEVGDYEDKKLILVGGPCANSISEEITDLKGYNCDDWKFKDGESLVKIFENGKGKVILIAGTSFYDTAKISEMIARYEYSEKLKTSDEIVIGTPREGLCGNEICEDGETDENCISDCSNEGSIQLTSGYIVKDFDIYGDYITFSDSSFVYLYDFNSKEIQKIGEGYTPRIYENNIVFSPRKKKVELYIYNILNGETRVITENITTLDIDIYKDKVVWIENTPYEFIGEGYDRQAVQHPDKLMIYDIGNGVIDELLELNKVWTSFGGIYGDYIVYESPKYCKPKYCFQTETEVSSNNFVVEPPEQGDQDIWLYNLKTGENQQITSNDEDQRFPLVYENLIVWTDKRHTTEFGDTIYYYNASNGDEEIFEFSKNIKFGTPGIGISGVSFSGKYVSWADIRNGREDVYVYDLGNEIERRITFNSESQGGAKIFENKIVWIDHRNGGQDLYMAEL